MDVEAARLEKLRSFHILDTPGEREFDAITSLAQQLLGCPFAVVSLVDEDRQWFKSVQGLDATQTPRRDAFCNHTIYEDDLLIVEDASTDIRFRENPLVLGNPHVRFYAGVPLRPHSDAFPDDLPGIGSLCVIDSQPRTFSKEQAQILRDLASLVSNLFQSRVSAENAKRLTQIAEEQASILDRRNRQLLQAERMAGIGSWRFDLTDQQIQWSDQVFRIHGFPIGDPPDYVTAMSVYAPDDQDKIQAGLYRTAQNLEPYDFECDLHMTDGRIRRVRMAGEAELHEGKAVAIVGVFQDVTDRHLREEQLRLSASTDSLTNLPNRASFESRFTQIVAAHGSRPNPFALILADLDGFKGVNDNFGHEAGDEVLCQMAQRMMSGNMANAFAARLGGDEFALIVTRPRDCRNLSAYLSTILPQLRLNVVRDGVVRSVSATLGAVMVDRPGSEPGELMRKADLALYTAKRQERGTAAMFGSDDVIRGEDSPKPVICISAH